MVTLYRAGKPVSRNEDINGDGCMDRSTRYDEQGWPLEVRADTQHRGKVDRVIAFKEGKPYEDRLDADGRFEQVIIYKDGRPWRQEVDEKGMDQPRLVVIFDEQGRKAEVRQVFQGDGKFNTYQFYHAG